MGGYTDLLSASVSDNNKPIEIKVSVLEVIYSAMMPIYHRLNSLLEDVIHKRVLVSETDRSALLDYCACAGGLKVMFENYFGNDFGRRKGRENFFALSRVYCNHEHVKDC